MDSPLEGAGFELLVPLCIDAAGAGQMTAIYGAASPNDPCFRSGDRRFESALLQRRVMSERTVGRAAAGAAYGPSRRAAVRPRALGIAQVSDRLKLEFLAVFHFCERVSRRRPGSD